jgi:hypothetical protein
MLRAVAFGITVVEDINTKATGGPLIGVGFEDMLIPINVWICRHCVKDQPIRRDSDNWAVLFIVLGQSKVKVTLDGVDACVPIRQSELAYTALEMIS